MGRTRTSVLTVRADKIVYQNLALLCFALNLLIFSIAQNLTLQWTMTLRGANG